MKDAADSLSPITKKNIAFRYEEEVRVIYSHLHHHSSDFNKNLGNGIVVDINRDALIKKIIVSPRADNWFYSLVEQITEKLPANVEWSRLRDNPFKSNIGEI